MDIATLFKAIKLGINGVDCYREAAARHPDLAGHFLFTTGVLPDTAQNVLQAISDRLLQRPFARTELVAAAREVLR